MVKVAWPNYQKSVPGGGDGSISFFPTRRYLRTSENFGLQKVLSRLSLLVGIWVCTNYKSPKYPTCQIFCKKKIHCTRRTLLVVYRAVNNQGYLFQEEDKRKKPLPNKGTLFQVKCCRTAEKGKLGLAEKSEETASLSTRLFIQLGEAAQSRQINARPAKTFRYSRVRQIDATFIFSTRLELKNSLKLNNGS